MSFGTFPRPIENIDVEKIRQGDGRETGEAIGAIIDTVNESVSHLRQLSEQTVLTPLYARLYHASAAQVIPNGADTFVKWDTPPDPGNVTLGTNVGGMFDPLGSASYGANGDEYVYLREPGLYLIEANLLWDTNTTGDRRAEILLLGSLDAIDRVRTLASTSSATGVRQKLQSLVAWRALGSGWNGRIAVQVFQNSGGARNLGSAGIFYDHWLAVTRVGALR